MRLSTERLRACATGCAEVTVSAGLPPGVPVDVQLTPCRTNEVKK